MVILCVLVPTKNHFAKEKKILLRSHVFTLQYLGIISCFTFFTKRYQSFLRAKNKYVRNATSTYLKQSDFTKNETYLISPSQNGYGSQVPSGVQNDRMSGPNKQSNSQTPPGKSSEQYPGIPGQRPGTCDSFPGSCSMHRGMSVHVPSGCKRYINRISLEASFSTTFVPIIELK